MSKLQPIKVRGDSLVFSFSFKGKPIRETTGYKVGQEELAYKAYLQKRKQLTDEANGIYTHRTIQDAMIRYVEEKMPTLKGQNRCKSHVKTVLESIDETRPLADIYQVANKMIAEMQAATKIDKETGKTVPRYANSTINKRSTVLSSIATLSYSKWKWLSEPPYKKICRLSERKLARDIYIPPEDVERLMDNCQYQLTADVVFFSAYTGIRTAELWRLNENSLHGNDLHVDGKGDKHRVIPLEGWQVDFIKKNIPITTAEESLKRDFRNARKKCGMTRYRFHDLRHTFGTLMAKAGAPQYKIMKLMGHSTDMMARRYINLSVDDLRGDMPTPPTRPTQKPVLKAVS